MIRQKILSPPNSWGGILWHVKYLVFLHCRCHIERNLSPGLPFCSGGHCCGKLWLFLFCPKNVALSAAVFVFLYRRDRIGYQRSVAQKPACSTAYDAPATANPVFGILFGICTVKPLRKPSSVSSSDIKPDGQSVLLFSGGNSVFVWDFKISKDCPEALNFGAIFLFCTDFLFSLSHPFAQSTRKIFYKKQKVLDLNWLLSIYRLCCL